MINILIGKEGINISTSEYNEKLELLQYIIGNGMIDLSDMQKQINMKKKEHYLSQHPYQIYQGSNGKWFTYFPDKEKGRVLRKRNTENEIKEMVIDYYKSKELNPIFKEVFLSWMDEKISLNEIGKGTYDRYINDYKRFFNGTDIEKTKFNQITEDELEIFIRKAIVDHKLSQKSYSNLRTLIFGIFKHAKKKKYTAISITSFINDLELSKRAFKKTVKNKEDQIYLEDEIILITDYLKNNLSVINLGLLLTFQTGIRTGELATLKFSDVKGKSISVKRQEIKYKDEVNNKCIHEVYEYTKTDAGLRSVIITESAIETINQLREFNPNGEFMFEVNGKRILTNSYNDALKRACKAIGINVKSMHKIRRTYGTTLIDNNVPDSVIMEQMGHSDITTTRKFYYYSNKNQKTKEEQIEKAINI